jgi:hypothetical protein
MNDIQQRLIRALVAAQVAVLEWGEEDVRIEGQATSNLDECLKQAVKLTKKLEGGVR